MDGVAVELGGEVHRLEPKLRDPSNSPAERDCPDVTRTCLPVGGDDGPAGEVPAFFHVVVGEVLEEELVHCRFVPIRVAGHGPVVVCEGADRPMWGLYESDHGRPHAEFSLSEVSGIGGGGKDKSRADAPDHFALFRRDEE